MFGLHLFCSRLLVSLDPFFRLFYSLWLARLPPTFVQRTLDFYDHITPNPYATLAYLEVRARACVMYVARAADAVMRHGLNGVGGWQAHWDPP